MAFLLKTSSRTPSLVLHTALSILPSLVTDMTAVRLSDQTTVICLTAASASMSSMRTLSVSSSASSKAGAGGGQDIDAVLAQVSALRSEIDRLIALVNTAAKKLEE